MTSMPHPHALAGLFTAPMAERVPVFLVTGFLGSGKTTLVREMLAHPGMADSALIINEFGEVGLDQILVQSAIENVLLMENGCVCCSIRGDLVDTIGDLFAKAQMGAMPPFSRIIIETTGLADPGPIVQELTSARGLAQRIRLEKVIVTVDGVLGSRQLQQSEEVAAQVAHADLCLVTKCDLVDPNVVNVLVQDIRDINPTADVMRADRAGTDMARLFARVSFGVSRRSAVGDIRCDGGDVCTHPPGTACPGHQIGTMPAPAGRSRVHRTVQSWSARIDQPLSWPKVRDWLDLLYSVRPANMLRMKGILHLAGCPLPIVVQGVGVVVSDPIVLDRWATPDARSEIVIITRNLDSDTIARAFAAIVLDGEGFVDHDDLVPRPAGAPLSSASVSA